VSEGEPLRQICREEGMPAWRTVYQWRDAHKDFDAAIARARIPGFDAIAEETLEISDDSGADFIETDKGPVFNSEHVQRAKLRIETRLKLLAKWDPKRYGEKLALGGADDLPPIRTMSDDQLLARIAALQAKLDGKA
jgi:hypothetical protein